MATILHLSNTMFFRMQSLFYMYFFESYLYIKLKCKLQKTVNSFDMNKFRV